MAGQNEVYRQYARAYHTIIPLTSFHKEIVQQTISALRGRSTILDAGCGTGILAAKLAAEGHTVHAVDSSTDMLAIAESSLQLGEGTVLPTFNLGDITSLGYSDGFFDGISCLNVLYHLPSPSGAVSEFRRVLRKGGILVLSGPNKNFDKTAFIKQVEETYVREGIAQQYPLEVRVVIDCNKQLSSHMNSKMDSKELSDLLNAHSFRVLQSNDNAYFGNSHFVVGERL